MKSLRITDEKLRKELWFEVPSRRGFVNITPEIEIYLAESKMREGIILSTQCV